MKSPQQIADKFKMGLANSGEAYKSGVNAVQSNPAQKAIDAKDKWAQKVQEAVANDSFAKGLAGVTITDWKAASTNAASKLTGAAAAAAPKVLKYFTKAAPQIQSFQQQIDAMPSTTDADNEARAVKMIQLMRQLKGINRS